MNCQAKDPTSRNRASFSFHHSKGLATSSMLTSTFQNNENFFINEACVASSFEATTPNKEPSYICSISIGIRLQCGIKIVKPS